MCKILNTIACIFFVFSLLSQSSNNGWIKKGLEAEQKLDYAAAAAYYLEGYKANEDQVDLLLNHAHSLRKMNENAKALLAYDQVIEKDKNKTMAEAFFYKALLLKIKGSYEESKQMLSVFSKTYRRAPSLLKRRAKNELVSIDVAQKIVLDTLALEVQRADEPLNSKYADFAPKVFDNTLYYAQLKYDENTKEATNIKQKPISIIQASVDTSVLDFGKPQTFDLMVNNSAYHQANFVLTKDRKLGFFSRCEGRDCALYKTKKTASGWSEPQMLPMTINPEGYSSTQPFVVEVSKKEYLFFSSNKRGGKGGFDIFYAEIKNNGDRFSTPKNAGRTINSPGNEVTPFYNTQDGCLYFSSDWHHGLGGYDIFKSCGPLKSLSVPNNVGIPLNSSHNDLYFALYDQYGLLSSNRPYITASDTQRCCSDIYAFKYPPKDSTDTITDIYTSLEQLNKYLPVTLYFHNDRPDPKTTDTLTSKNYLETYTRYTDLIDTYKKEYAKGLDDTLAQTAQEDIEDFFFQKVDKGVSDLQMFMALLEKELKAGRSFLLTVKGYASPLAKSDYNEKLTLRRISSLQNYVKQYKNGALLSFLENGNIQFKKEPFGEYRADTTVSDNFHDVQNSVYSIKAAQERKIEVLSVSLAQNIETSKAETISSLEVDSLIDLGTLRYGSKSKSELTLKNTGSDTLHIYDIESECSCTVVNEQEFSLAPGERKALDIIFKATKKGVVTRKMQVLYTGKVQLSKIIYVKADVK